MEVNGAHALASVATSLGLLLVLGSKNKFDPTIEVNCDVVTEHLLIRLIEIIDRSSSSIRGFPNALKVLRRGQLKEILRS